jgi:hypothetical protein
MTTLPLKRHAWRHRPALSAGTTGRLQLAHTLQLSVHLNATQSSLTSCLIAVLNIAN